MANPLVLFENILDDGTLTVTTTPASGFPIDNINDWRTGTAYRWVSGSTTGTQIIKVDLGVGNTASPNTWAIAGHNLGTVSAGYVVAHSDNDSSWTNVASGSFTDDLPFLETFTGSAHRYWRIVINGATWSAAPQIGVLCLGRRLDFSEPAQPDLDPYGIEAVVEDSANENGSWIGTNTRYTRKRFTMNYDTPGFLASDFFTPSSGLGWDDDFIPHAVTGGKPFFFAWNIDVDTDETYLCKVDGYSVQMPHSAGNTLRRGLQCTFEGRREVA